MAGDHGADTEMPALGKDRTVAEPHESTPQLATRSAKPPPRAQPSKLRVPARNERAVYRLRVALSHSTPPIWRRLDVRSDVYLDVLHQVLQAAFEWNDSHLHRFALGEGPFSDKSELFLCPFDMDEGDDEGTAASEVRLDETLHSPGDLLHYAYDYGDGWQLTIHLEEVLVATAETPIAICTGGRRAAPPEDCGGRVTAQELAEVLDNPEHFDVARLNDALAGPRFSLT